MNMHKERKRWKWTEGEKANETGQLDELIYKIITLINEKNIETANKMKGTETN